MIDLHAHILPGLDDGAEDMPTALAMARVAQSDGVGTVVATPHSVQWGQQCSQAALQARLKDLETALRQNGLPLQVLPGIEAYLAPDLLQQLEQGHVFPLNGGRYLLVELPHYQYPPYTDQVIFELQVRGLVPILAHPERNAVFQKDPQRLFALAARGVKAQVTAASLTGAFGGRARQAAQIMVQCHLAQIIASDAHAAAGSRSPMLSAAVAAATTLVGRDQALAMVTSAPAAIIGDQEIAWESPRPPQGGRRWWAFWR